MVSFPHGLDATAVKQEAARRAVADGADELDVVIAYALLDEDPAAVAHDLGAWSAAAGGATVKAIVEAPVLTPAQLERACDIVAASGADVRQDRDRHAGPATVEQVAAMRRALPGGVAVKASGGIRTASDAADAAGGRRRPAGDERRRRRSCSSWSAMPSLDRLISASRKAVERAPRRAPAERARAGGGGLPPIRPFTESVVGEEISFVLQADAFHAGLLDELARRRDRRPLSAAGRVSGDGDASGLPVLLADMVVDRYQLYEAARREPAAWS